MLMRVTDTLSPQPPTEHVRPGSMACPERSKTLSRRLNWKESLGLGIGFRVKV